MDTECNCCCYLCCYCQEETDMATKKVVEKEASSEDVTFDYEGVTYTIPPGNLWPIDAIEAQEKMKLVTFIRALLGEEQYKNLRKTATTLQDLDKFISAMFEEIELEPGK